MAYISSEIFMSDYISLMDINSRETENLKLAKNKAYDAVYCGNYCAFRIKKKNDGLQLYFRKTYEKLLKQYEIDYAIMSSKNDYFTLRVDFTYREYINEKRKFFVEMQDDLFMTANKDDTFSCCYLYKQCSDAMECISDSPSQKYMCKYYRNLRCGKIFYGDRSVLDEKHHINEELVQRNKALMGNDEVCPIVIEGGEQLEIPVTDNETVTVLPIIDNKTKRKKGISLVEFKSTYTVIDIETTGLSPEFDEIIELSAIKCIDDKVIDKFSTLVRPENEIDEYITELTGITNEMLSTAPMLEDVLSDYISFISDDVIIGHNVNFDINFIYDKYMEIYQKEFKNDYFDLLRISRKLFPDLKNHKLITLAEEFKVNNKPTHRGADDCQTTLECYLYCKKYAIDNNIELKTMYRAKADLTKLTPDSSYFDSSHPLYGKVCVFTGTLEYLTRTQAAQLVVNIGGRCGNTVTQSTDYLILGNNDYCSTIKDGKSSKQKKAEKLILEGQDLKILPESVFYDLIFDE